MSLRGLQRACRFYPSLQCTRSVRAFCAVPEYEKPDVRKLAQMAQIHVTEEEVQHFSPCNISISMYYSGFSLHLFQFCMQDLLVFEQVEAWTPQLNKVTEFFAQLQAMNLTDVPPMLRVDAELKGSMRKDEVVEHPSADSIVRAVPETDDGFLKVPRIQSQA
jgi:aspartyl/glutamyl-tRNA(Asn/Gln) amidotransferase C subunit